ncbi:sensor histidine kinase [Nocardioides sp. AN3]
MLPINAEKRAVWAGVLLLAPSLVCLALTIWLDLHTDPTGVGAQYAPGWAWSYALIGAIQAMLAAVILVRDPRQGFGWGLGWLGLFWATDGLAQAYIRYGISATDALPGMNLALWNLNRIGSFLPLAGSLILFTFPTGRFLPGAWRVASWVATGSMTLANLVLLIAPARNLPDVALPPGVDVDWATLRLPAAVVDVGAPLVVATSVAGLLFSMVTVVVRYRRSRGRERDQMRWLLWSVVAMALLLALSVGLELPGGGDFVIFAIMVLPSVAMTIAIVDPELVSIEDLLARTLVYGVLAGVILLADLAVITALSAVLGDSLSQRQIVLIVLLVSVLLYSPLRGRLAHAVQALMLGKRTDPYDVVAGLASTLESIDEGPQQLAAVARAVAVAFRVRYVAVEVDRGTGERLLATYGDPPAQTRSLPIVYRGAEVGRLVLPARGARSRLSRRDAQLLNDLVRQAAAAARTSGLAEEVQRSRERLVTAREEERRRIRRDLHDGLGPALSGVVFQLESARLLAERDPATAATRLQETSRTVQDVVADVRRLVHDLRPPALDDLGLTGALRQLAGQLERGGPAVSIAECGLPALPAAVEVAAYRIVAEALTNIVRHAGATRADVRLCAADGALHLEVRDDGSGLSEEVQAGVGLRSMRERAVELGGHLEVTCPASGGTVVTATLPIATLPERGGVPKEGAQEGWDERQDGGQR